MSPPALLRVLYRMKADQDTGWDVVERPPGAFVAQLKKTIMSDAALNVPPQQVKLALEETGAEVDGSLTLEAAGIGDGSRILVTVMPLAPPGES